MIGKSLNSAHRNRKRKLCKQTAGTKLYQDDHKDLIKICERNHQTEGEALREIVSDWLRSKRVEALGRNQVEDPIRKIYERIIEEQISPLVESIKNMKSSLEKLSKGHTAYQDITPASLPPTDQLSRIMESVAGLRSLLEQTGSDLSETAATQINQLDQLHKSQLTVQSISSETYAAGWSILDLMVRYLVEVDLRSQGADPDKVEAEVSVERRGLRLEGLRKIAGIEDFFGLPEEFRLAQLVLSSRTFPMSKQNQNPLA